MLNPVKIIINFLAKILSKIKCKCHSDCCAIDCDSISAEEYKDIMIEALKIAEGKKFKISYV